jgi:hypothetical protein
MKQATIKLLMAFVMIATMAGCASMSGTNPEYFNSLAHPEAYSPQ